MLGYKTDPGGRFASDTHRRVLGHLSRPDEAQAWSVPALHNRMLPDVGTNIQSHEEMQQVLNELEAEGHAERVQVGDMEVWRMTPQGFEVVTGPIKDEPPPGAAVQGPANIGLPVQGIAVTQLDEHSDLDITRPGYHNPDSPPPGSENPPAEQEAEVQTGENAVGEGEAE